MHRCDSVAVQDAAGRLSTCPRGHGSHPQAAQDAKQPTLQPSKMHRCDPVAVQAGSGSMDQLGRSPLRVPSVGKCASQKKNSIQDATMRLSNCPRCHRPILHKSKMQSSDPPGQVRSGQVRYITRPKSRTMRVTRQLMLPPSTVT